MDKLVRRTRMAERQASRRAARSRYVEFRSKQAILRDERSDIHREIGAQLAAAIKTRHDDWELGPLAPRLGVSVLNTPFNTQWGTISPARARPNSPLPAPEIKDRCAWAGGDKFLCLARGDRVAVIEGWQKGKIDVVNEIDLELGTVSLASISKVNVHIPRHMLPSEAGGNRIQAIDSAIPISAVRLVHPLRDEETGTTRDVVIQKIRPTNKYFDRPTHKWSWDRVVPGPNVEIPWPKTEDAKEVDHASDTLRIDAEEKTFVPTLLRPPMPEAVINELRNQYSKFRTRHTDEYIAKKEAEEAEKKARQESVASMRTPLQELNRQQREARRARGQPELTDDVLERIGQVMAKNQRRTLGAMGVAGIERGPDLQSVDSTAEPSTTPPS